MFRDYGIAGQTYYYLQKQQLGNFLFVYFLFLVVRWKWEFEQRWTFGWRSDEFWKHRFMGSKLSFLEIVITVRSNRPNSCKEKCFTSGALTRYSIVMHSTSCVYWKQRLNSSGDIILQRLWNGWSRHRDLHSALIQNFPMNNSWNFFFSFYGKQISKN